METKVTSEQVELIDSAFRLLTAEELNRYLKSEEWEDAVELWVERYNEFQKSLTDGSVDEVEF